MNARLAFVLPLLLASTVAFASEPASAEPASAEPEPAADPAPAAKPTFAELDANADGAIDKAEASTNAALTAAFDGLDADKSGTLSAAEFDAWK